MKHVVFHAPGHIRPNDLLRKKLGCKGRPIGSGAYACVYWSPSLKRVIKIGELSDPYLDYVSSIKSSKPSPFFPKIDQVFECFEAGSDWEDREGSYAVVMERLQSSHHRKFEVARAIVCSKFDTWDSELDEYDEEDVAKYEAAAFVKKAVKAAKHVARLCDRAGADLDMHDGNILFRKNGQLVITDPFC